MSQGTRPLGESDPLIGMPVDHFVVQRQIASGGMGAVYLMTHERPTIKRRAVLKVLLPEYAQNAAIRQRFETEAEAASQLEHDNILKLENFGVLPDGQLYMIVPFLDGQPLDQYLASQGGKLPIGPALHIVKQICGAVDFAHRKGIVHRDIKPGNIFLIETPVDSLHAKLLDFGIAKMQRALQHTNTRTGMALGTPSYMPCELYDRANEATHSADVFAIAVVTYEMLCGSLPWGIHDPGILYFKQRTEMPVCPPEIPPECFAVIAQSLAFDPATRAPSALAFLRALERAHPLGRISYGELPPTQVARAVTPPTTGPTSIASASSEQQPAFQGPLTTLSSSSGVTDVPKVASSGRLRLALAGGLLSIAAAGVGFAITMSRGGASSTTTEPEPNTSALPSVHAQPGSAHQSSSMQPSPAPTTPQSASLVKAPTDVATGANVTTTEQGSSSAEAAATAKREAAPDAKPEGSEHALRPQHSAVSRMKRETSRLAPHAAQAADPRASSVAVSRPPSAQPEAPASSTVEHETKQANEPHDAEPDHNQSATRTNDSHAGSAQRRRPTFDPNAAAGDD